MAPPSSVSAGRVEQKRLQAAAHASTFHGMRCAVLCCGEATCLWQRAQCYKGKVVEASSTAEVARSSKTGSSTQLGVLAHAPATASTSCRTRSPANIGTVQSDACGVLGAAGPMHSLEAPRPAAAAAVSTQCYMLPARGTAAAWQLTPADHVGICACTITSCCFAFLPLCIPSAPAAGPLARALPAVAPPSMMQWLRKKKWLRSPSCEYIT